MATVWMLIEAYPGPWLADAFTIDIMDRSKLNDTAVNETLLLAPLIVDVDSYSLVTNRVY